jgi:D-xylose 1-dehydrogenase (NADP+, D-xylono-1,5-lactone-forming)
MNNPSKLRWGILGGARVNERLLPAIVEASNSQLVAIASRRAGAAAETLQKYAPQHSGTRTYDTLEALLDDAKIQSVYLPMANHEHAEWALRAIACGKHVLIEKPMALTVADIEAIDAAAAKHKVTVMEGFMYRFHPQHARVQEIVSSGLIGEVRSARASYSFMMRQARMYRLANNTDLGGGAMWDIGPYAIHSLRWCFGVEPLSVMATAKYAESGADSVTSGVLDFGAGRLGHFDISFERSRKSEYEIIGTRGGVKCHAAWQLPGDVPVISWWTDDGRENVERYPASNHFNLEIEHFSDCVLTGKVPLLTLQDAKANCRTIVATLKSAASGQTEKIA